MKKKETTDDKIEIHIGMGESGYITYKQLKYIIICMLTLGLLMLYGITKM